MKLTKRLIALILSLLTLIPVLGSVSSSASDDFSDVDKGKWYYDAVMWSLEKGFFKGTSENTFSPDSTLTRGQLVTVLSAFDGSDTEKYKSISNFSDVITGCFYTGSVEWARKFGIVAGTGEGRFSPLSGVTREQFCVMLKSFVCDYLGYTFEYVNPEVKFTDEISQWAKEAVTWAQRCGLVSGTSKTTFSAKAKCTRAMTAQIIKRTYEAIPKQKVVAYYHLQASLGSDYETEYIDVFNLHPTNVKNGPGSEAPFSMSFNYNSISSLKNRLRQKNPDAKFIFTVANGSLSVFESWLFSYSNCESFAYYFAKAVEDYDFDGVDIDYEFPTNTALRENFVKFIMYLREDLDELSAKTGKTYTISLAVPAGQWAFSLFDICGLEPYVDWFNIMNYDLYCGSSHKFAHHHAPPYDNAVIAGGSVCSDIALYKENGIPASKIVPGCGMYSRRFNNVEPGENGDGLYQYGEIDDSNIHYSELLGYYYKNEATGKYEGKNGFTYYWDDNAKAPYLYNAESKQLLTFDNEESVSYKTELIKSGLCGGIMVFDYCTCDGVGFFKALDKMLANR